MAKILILIGSHLCTAPRPQKEAETLASAGHQVMVRGVWFDPERAERDRQLMAGKSWQFAPVLDFRPQNAWKNWQTRSIAKLAKVQYQQVKRFSPALLGYGAKALLKAALQEQADLTIVHSEAGLWVGEQLLQRGFRVGVDFEDWFSQDLLPAALNTRPVAELKRLEGVLIRNCVYCLTTSHALADRLASVYQAPRPAVVYNTFPATPPLPSAPPAPPPALPHLHWFSQTIGPGRGLETLFQSLAYVQSNFEIHLRGDYPKQSRQWLEPLVPEGWHDRLFIHPTVPNDELPSCIAEHDVGLALEQPQSASRNLTITNKLFQYLQAGLAVIATDTRGQREVFDQAPGIGQFIPCDHPVALALAIDDLLQNPLLLEKAKAQAIQAAQTIFSWQQQGDRLLQAAETAIHS